MALINCPGCGGMVSEIASYCPHCGHRLNGGNAHHLSGPVAPQKKKNNAALWVVIAAIAITLLVGIGVMVHHNNEEQALEQARMQQKQMDLALEEARLDSMNAAERARQDSIAATEAAEQARQDSINEAHENTVSQYLAKMREFRNSDEGEGGEYFLFDITGNGVPELWMTSTFGYGGMYVYTYSHDNLKHIFTGSGGHASYHKGKGYVIENMAHMGYQKISKLTYRHGKISEQTMYESEDENADYREVSEPAFHYYKLSDESPVINMFN